MPKKSHTNQMEVSERYENKVALKSLLVKWKGVIDHDRTLLADKTLCNVIRDVKDYSNMDHSVAYREEGKLYNKILKGMQKHQKNLETKLQKSGDIKLEQVYSMMMDLNAYFVIQKEGYLQKPTFADHHIISTDKKLLGGKSFGDSNDKMVQYKDTPLFAHDPSMEDIKHGSLKNEHLNTTLGMIVEKNPDFIKESMLDNNNGTVTVRLYQGVHPVDQGEKPKDHVVYKPIYVTVDKTMPEGSATQNSLWVNLYEKALAASGMFYGDKDNPEQRPVPGNIDALYNKYRNLPKTEWPTRQECPWLISEDGQLRKWTPSYKHLIQKGTMGNIMEAVLGEEGRSSVKELNYDPQKSLENKTNQFLRDVYGGIISGKTKDKSMARRIEGYARVRCNNDSQIFLKNLQICAAIVSSMSKEKADSYFKEEVQYDEKGRILFGSGISQQRMLEYLEEEIRRGVVTTAQRGYYENPKELLKDAFDRANYNVMHDPDPVVKLFATDSVQSLNEIRIAAFGREYKLDDMTKGYTKEQEKIFQDLGAMLEKGKFIVAGTKSAESLNEKESGLDSDHSYGVVGISKETHNGKEYQYVLLTDPDKTNTAITYDYSGNPPIPQASGDGNGIKKVELSHFCSSFKQLTMGGSVMETMQIADNMLTRQMTSEYSNFLEYFGKQLGKEVAEMKDSLQKKAFEELQSLLTDKKSELQNGLGKDIKSLSFKGIREKAGHCKEILEGSEKADPKQGKLLNRIQTISQMFDNGLKNPKGLLLDTLEKSMEQDNMLDTYTENDCIRTVISSKDDISKLKQGLDRLESKSAKKSPQYENMQKEEIKMIGHAF